MRRLTARPGWQIWLGIGGLAVIGSSLVPPNVWYDNVIYDLIGAVSTVMIVVGVRHNRPSDPRTWYLFAVGQGIWVIGDVTYAYYSYVLGQDPFPSIADGFYLGGYPLLAAGLFLLIRSRTSGRDLAGLLDASIIATGLSVLAWEFMMRPVALDTSLTTTAQLISIGYPATDILLLVMLVRLLTGPGARTASYQMLIIAMVLLLGCDVAYSVWNTYFSYIGCPLDPGYLTSYVLFGAAALHPSMRSLSEVSPGQVPRFGPGRFMVLTSASLFAPALLFIQGSLNPTTVDWLGIGLGSVALFLLVLTRMYGLVARVQDQASQLAALAHNDALTGIPNRRSWDIELVRAMALARRENTALAVAIIDLDYFKRFNDSKGHQAGDRLLTQSAAVWRSQLRDTDLIARYGGEEFGVLLSGTSTTDATAVLQRMLASTPDGQTFSAGLVVWNGDETPEQLVGRADNALYRAKDSGRNRVETVKPAESPGEPTQPSQAALKQIAPETPVSPAIGPPAAGTGQPQLTRR